MTVIERYTRFIGNIEEHQKSLRAELAELSVKNLTKDERDYTDTLMGYIKRNNSMISSAEYDIGNVKRRMGYAEIKGEA